MTSLKCHHLLDLPVSFFIKDISNIPHLPIDKEFHVTSCDPHMYLHDNVYKKLSELGSLSSLVFSMKPGADKKSIHIDLDSKTQTPYWLSLNIIIDGQGVMRWFNPIKPGYVLKNNSAGVFYKAWFHDYGNIVDEWNVGKVALVRTDIPHQVWNLDNDTRRIVSIRWNKKLSWDDTIKWFSNILINT